MELKKINLLLLLLTTMTLSVAAQKEVPSAEPQAYVGPFRAYFQATDASADAPSLSMMFSGYYNPGEGSDPNAIEPVVRTIDRDGTQRVFDLSDSRIDGNVKGIVIKNGRKVVVR